MLKLIEEKQMCVDKLDANKSRESTGWEILGGSRGACDVEKIVD